MEVFNVFGEKVKNLQVASSKVEIDLSNESKGIYFVRETAGEKPYSVKVVME